MFKMLRILFVPFLIILLVSCNLSYAQNVKFVQITDVHLNPNRNCIKSRMVKYSKDLLLDTIQQVNAMKDVDFVVFTGDNIDRPDEKLLIQFAKTANKLNVPWYWTTGNHDLGPRGVNRNKFLEIMNKYNDSVKQEKAYYSFKKEGNLFIFLDGAIDEYITAQGLFSEDNIKFLNKELRDNKNLSAFIFQHFPVIYPMKSKDHGVINQDEYLEVINDYQNVKAIFTGHFHVTKIAKRNNVLHINTPALVQYPNAFRIITIKNTSDGKILNIETKETGLKQIQNKSKQSSPSADLMKGKESDRNASFLLNL